MPNWCECDLSIKGPKKKVQEVMDFIGEDFDFNKIIPYPEEYKIRDLEANTMDEDAFIAKYGSWKDGYNSGGFSWCCDNWGTKWPPSRVTRKKTCVSFETPWCVPTPVISKLHEMFPEVTIILRGYECGMGWSGGFKCCRQKDTLAGEDWKPGLIEQEWSKEYKGHRGG
jgi:hypothetical protein